MDRISSNPYFNPAQIYQQNHLARQTPQADELRETSSGSIQPTQVEEVSSNQFSQMFDDDALLKLQSNLESIAQMAESALKGFDK